jgi:hypothetical protein
MKVPIEPMNVDNVESTVFELHLKKEQVVGVSFFLVSCRVIVKLEKVASVATWKVHDDETSRAGPSSRRSSRRYE